jgi:hypothetical protein
MADGFTADLPLEIESRDIQSIHDLNFRPDWCRSGIPAALIVMADGTRHRISRRVQDLTPLIARANHAHTTEP